MASTLSPTELRAAATRRSRESVVFAARHRDPSYQPSAVHYLVADALEAVAAGKCKRLIINMPPRHGKTRLTAIEFAAWFLGNHPDKSIVNAGYARDLALDSSKACRDILRSDWHKQTFPRCRIHPFDQAANEWRTVQGGGYLAVGVEGALTGKGADILIVDDPHKDHKEASSPTERENVWKWYQSVAQTRLSPTGAVIIIQTRWHVDDLSGRLLNPERQMQLDETGLDIEPWRVINLPALAESEDDLLGRNHDEALWPERWPASMMRALRAEMMPLFWNALYRGDPEVEGGNYVDVRKLGLISRSDLPRNMRWARFWDLATDEKTKDDFTAGARVAVHQDGRMFIDGVHNEKLKWPSARNLIARIGRGENLIMGIEAVAGFKTSVDNLKEVAPELHVRGINVVDDKLTRALSWLSKVQAGECWMVADEWNGMFISQLRQFPSGDHDDMIDAVSGGYAMAKALVYGSVEKVERARREAREAMRLGLKPERERRGNSGRTLL